MNRGMYEQKIIDHSRQPHNFHGLADADGHSHQANPLCGDEIDFYLKYDQAGRVTAATFQGRGCAISQAAASMLTEKLIGLTRSEIDALAADDVNQLLGVTVTPARITCATLGLKAAQAASAELK